MGVAMAARSRTARPVLATRRSFEPSRPIRINGSPSPFACCSPWLSPRRGLTHRDPPPAGRRWSRRLYSPRGGSRGSGSAPGGSGSDLFSSLFGPTAPAVRPARRRRTDGPARPGHPRPDRRAANGRSVGDRGVLRRDEPAGSPRPGSGTDSRTPGPIPVPRRRPALAGGGWSVAGGGPATGWAFARLDRDGW